MMWRRIYLILVAVRIFFALSPSTIHPDEHFQGPEVLAGIVFPFSSVRTWEWTVATPIRSVFPIWLSYGLPMTILQWVVAMDTNGTVSPRTIYYTLRMVMFLFSFVLEDWAIHELVHSPPRRHLAMVMVASSYVTWTFQTHTFSNSMETLAVLWSLILIERISDEKKRSSIGSCVLLGFLAVFGVFNRITFPAFLVIPGIQLLPQLRTKPFGVIALTASIALWTFIAIAADTAFYTGSAATSSFRALFRYVTTTPVITPLNNLLYNTKVDNLAHHGLHPLYQHLLVNAPQLLGPALILLLYAAYLRIRGEYQSILYNKPLTSAISGVLILSLIPHQEPRFILPCIPLLLTNIRLPSSTFLYRLFWTTWIIFNLLLGTLMGIYHQGSVVPAQLALPNLISSDFLTTKTPSMVAEVFWWKTYPPPVYLLGSPPLHPSISHPQGFPMAMSRASNTIDITTTPLLGMSETSMLANISASVPTCHSWSPFGMARILQAVGRSQQSAVYIVAPVASWRSRVSTSQYDFNVTLPDEKGILDGSSEQLRLTNLAMFRNHINLDDLDFAEDGMFGTLGRVIGRRGLGVWKVDRVCDRNVKRDEVVDIEDGAEDASAHREAEERNAEADSQLVTPETETRDEAADGVAGTMRSIASGAVSHGEL